MAYKQWPPKGPINRRENMVQMSLDLSAALRDHGAGVALNNAGASWNDRACEIALAFFKSAGEDGALFEDVRAYAELIGLPFPPSPNSWGAVALSMSKRNIIIKTGKWLNSRSVKSHARAQPIWRLK